MKKRVYIFNNGELKRKQNTLYFETDEGKKFIPVEGVSDFLIFGEVSFNKKLLDFLSQNQILIKESGRRVFIEKWEEKLLSLQ